jgi:hypothetical protein
MLGHEDVAKDEELVAGAELFELFEEEGSRVVVVEEWEATVTSEGDEVIVT